jgi:N-acetylglucosaminyldiphosphoundecaprenol N-acetyl-beta-D-mannosaminyltransferase
MSARNRHIVTTGIRVDPLQSLGAAMLFIVEAIETSTPWLMTFVNPATSVVAARRPHLRCMLREFDIVAPDGIGMVVAMRMLHRRKAERISFDSTSLAPEIFHLAAARKLSVALIGGAPGIAQSAQDHIQNTYDGISIIGVFDGYRNENEVLAEVMALDPKIVIVGMGTMLQEGFLLKLVESGWKGIGFTCGGYLDQLALKGTHYYPDWIDRYNLRWMYRFGMEPKRLWRRYLLEYPEFGLRLCYDLLRGSSGRLRNS